jgi:hypothetical protein
LTRPLVAVVVALLTEQIVMQPINRVRRLLQSASHYQFVTEWQVRATLGEVTCILADPVRLTLWWPAVYLDSRELEPGDAVGIGRTFQLVTKGWLPYTLRWRLTVTSVEASSLRLVADGDFDGTGEWTLEESDANVRIRYEWRVVARKPLLRFLSPILRRLFIRNHHWAMQRGEESLQLELARRRYPAAASACLPAPPAATPSSVIAWLFELGSPRRRTEPVESCSAMFTAKRLLAALHMAVHRHESAFGVLETDVQKRIQPSAATTRSPTSRVP